MIRVAIIEDEQHAIDALMALLQHSGARIELLGTASRYAESIELIEKTRPQLLFLDVQLRDCSGFDILRDSTYREMEVIFTTAFNQFAIKAFEEHAIGYLLKPIDPELFMKTFQRAATLLASKKLMDRVRNYEGVVTHFINRLPITTMEGTRYLDLDNIIQIEGNGAYSNVHLRDGAVVVVSKNIGHFEEELKSSGFIRCHRSHLVNTAHITGWIKRGGSKLRLSNGTTVLVSRARKEEVESLKKGNRPL